MGEKTQYDYLKGGLITFNKQKEELTKKVKKYCQNKEYPLNDRWKLFIESDLGKHENWIIDFDIIEIELIRDFNKYEVVKSIDLIYYYFDYISDKLYDELEITDNYGTDGYNNFIKTHINPKVDIFKEEILAKFIKSFTYDW